MRWVGQILRVRTATGEAAPAEESGGPAKEEGGGDGKADAKETPAKEEKPLPLLRGLEVPRTNEKPVLVYFHWPHEDGRRGKEIQKFCNGALDEEPFARVSALFHCVEINTRDSDLRLVEEAKVKATPALFVCRTDGTVMWRTDSPRVSGKGLASALLRVLEDEFPDRWKKIEEERGLQKKSLREGRALAAAGKLEDAAFALRNAVNSDVIYTDEWMEVRKLLFEVEAKLADPK